MEDTEIIRLFEARSEQAIAETTAKHGSLLHQIAMRILGNEQDAQECVSDVLMRLWNAIPPEKPESYPAYLSALTRNCAVSQYRRAHREKRGGGELAVVLDELSDCIADSEDVEQAVDSRLLRALLTQFLDGLSADHRTVFVSRYIQMLPVAEIAARYGMTQSKVKVSLLRTRRKLRVLLEKEGLL